MKGMFAFLAEALKFLNWWAPRRAAKNDAPETKDANNRKAIENEILKDDEAAANKRVHDALFRLRNRKAASDKQRPGD
jgi:hypothetical protein